MWNIGVFTTWAFVACCLGLFLLDRSSYPSPSLQLQAQAHRDAKAHLSMNALRIVDYNNEEESDEDDNVLYDDRMHLHLLDNAEYPDAVCNDGTPAGYYLIKDIADDSGFQIQDNRWLFFLEGGGWCWDEVSCVQRQSIYPNLISSKTWKPTRAYTGIFSQDPTKSPLATASKVFVPYCSSDGWVGDGGADSSTAKMHFRGQAIIKAVLSDLTRSHNFGLAGSPGAVTQLFFSGCSAGARGALFNLDYIPNLVPPGVEVRGILDSGLWVDMEPFATSRLTPLAEQTRQLLHFIKGSERRLGAECAKTYGDAQWKCLLGQYRAPLVTERFFLSEAQYDSFQLYWALGGLSPPYTGEAAAYANDFHTRMQQSMARISWHSGSSRATFSTACFAHCVTLSPEFWTTSVETENARVSFSGSLSEWMEREVVGDVRAVSYLDRCRGFNCGCQPKQAADNTGRLPIGQGWNDIVGAGEQ